MDVVQSVVLQIEVISISILIQTNQGFVSWLYFPTLFASTGCIHIHVALTGKKEGEGGKDICFFSLLPLFLHLSLNKKYPESILRHA